MTDARMVGPISLSVPPDPTLSRVVRLAASGVASLAGFTIDEIDSITLAVSEVLIALVEHGARDVVELEYSADDSSFTVRGRTNVQDFDTADPDLELCRTVLAGVADHFDIRVDDNRVFITATVARTTGR